MCQQKEIKMTPKTINQLSESAQSYLTIEKEAQRYQYTITDGNDNEVMHPIYIAKDKELDYLVETTCSFYKIPVVDFIGIINLVSEFGYLTAKKIINEKASQLA